MALLDGLANASPTLLGEATREAVKLSLDVFKEDGPAPDLRATLRALGRVGAMTAMAHDSLSSLQRLVA